MSEYLFSKGIENMKKMLSVQSGKQMKLTEAFEMFITQKKISNLREQSLFYYETCFKTFSKFYDTLLPCDGITKETILSYTAHLQDTCIKDITINSYLRGIRTIFYFFMEMGYVSRFSINLIKCDKEIKETYTNDELGLLLEKPDMKKCTFAEYRSWVVVNYLLGTGNRLGTIVNLRWVDIDFENGLIKLSVVKNRKQQLIPLSTTLNGILKEYRSVRICVQ